LSESAIVKLWDLRSISKEDVVAVIDKAMKRGPSAAVTAWKVAKAFVAWCEAREDDFVSPSRSIRKPAKEKSRDLFLNDTELKLTWEADDAAGMTELARDEITPDSIELRGDRTKNGIPHTIPIRLLIRRVLDTLSSSGTFVLNGTDRPFGDHSGQQSRSGRFMIFAAASRVDSNRSVLLRIN
jgi:hypothetical protein